jgi:diguanylate cyclase (GGDEF)-like protein
VSRLRRVSPRREHLAWFATVPVAALAVGLAMPLAHQSAAAIVRWPVVGLFVVLFALAQSTLLHLRVQGQAVAMVLAEIPLVLGLFYLPPLQLIVIRVLAAIAVQIYQRFSVVKQVFNAAAHALSSTVACVIVTDNPLHGVGPRSWIILGAAILASSATSFFTLLVVLSLVQGFPSLENVLRTLASTFAVALVNITLGLVVLLVIQVQPWSIVLLVGLCAMLVVVYRSYAQFVGQHRSLEELYELTLAMGDASRDGTLPDVLLMRVRELLNAEYATLWLPAHGRYPELLLTAHVDSPGLLDVSRTPRLLRERAVRDGVTVAVGPKLGDPGLRAMIRESGVKDAIVVPLRSGSAVIGLLEVTGRLGALLQFRPADVRLLEALAAQAAVAVENSRLVDRLRFDAYHDVLTGLPNRRRILALLEEAVKVRAPNEVVAVLLFDIDGLRDVNDSLGHDAGDLMVREVAARLRHVAPAAAQVGRASSDEFVLAVRLPDAEEALALASRLRTALQQPMLVDSIPLVVDVAVGIAVHPDHGAEAEVLLKRADLAAQAAKQFTTPIHLYRPSLQARSTHRSGLAADMRRALETGEVEVYFQPKVELRHRRVVGVECLARWEHPTQGHVSPGDFVSVAEHTGQLGRLTESVLREGLHRAKGWYEAGRPLPIAVNLSARTLIDPTFPQRVRDLLDQYGVPAELLTLEITEDGMVGEPDRPMSTLRRLHDLGLRLAVDDFGTGYSSLSYLRRLPVHEVKIDRSFVQGMATDAGDLAIVKAVVDLARHFGLSVVAEGVESEITASLLEEVGCDVGQGFLFSRALPFERFEAWLALQPAAPPASAAPISSPPATADPGEPGQPQGDIRRLRAVT